MKRRMRGLPPCFGIRWSAEGRLLAEASAAPDDLARAVFTP
jgi:hypothetical protein